MDVTQHVFSADANLNEALAGAVKLDELGIDGYTQNGAILVAELQARAALAEATTNRIRLLHDILRLPEVPMDVALPMQEERNRLIGMVITHGEA